MNECVNNECEVSDRRAERCRMEVNETVVGWEETRENTQDTYIQSRRMTLCPFTSQHVGGVIKHAKQSPGGREPRTALARCSRSDESHALPVPKSSDVAWGSLSCLNRFIHHSRTSSPMTKIAGCRWCCRPSHIGPATAATMPFDSRPTASSRCLT
jgi:hypothetical protein